MSHNYEKETSVTLWNGETTSWIRPKKPLQESYQSPEELHELANGLGVTYTPSNVNFVKDVYSSTLFRRNVDMNFNQLSNTSNRINLEEFFNNYNSVFFDIPKTGDNSHSTIIRESTDYVNNYIDPKDDIINDLKKTIEELELQISQFENENPIFKNGTLLKGTSNPNLYYMDKGYRREVVYNQELNTALKISAYGTTEPDIPKISDRMISGIPIGPRLTIENYGQPFNPDEITEEISNIYLELDPTQINLDPNKYNNIDDFRNALVKDIEEKENVLEVLDIKISAINTQINAIESRDPSYQVPLSDSTSVSING